MDESEPNHGVIEVEGDLFAAPDGAALIHACNSQGSWGAGIANTFRIRYPAAYRMYRVHCARYIRRPQYQIVSSCAHGRTSRRRRLPEGTALIIPPQEYDYEHSDKRHWIICLFTSPRFGQNRSSPEVILENTVFAIADMKRQLRILRVREVEGGPAELWSCRFNSGLFGVEWRLTRSVLEDAHLDVTVVRPRGGV
ncbi:hypothetical protein ASPZODRAFT_133621 [Penicilliopsis zonata CBS 506.65]|uniref:Uncharacterized protein n=1 Tax=Penicilliopsis zonata CBS 506.65 TaxID=1073090 RepID=A0A1L9SEY4_9EURO|nr:hypothetical protein ASPZODRAFT_133621 [Penicilliopsis zonata CBS 506.65]OJJ45751.1 hypothetical protein ASPZODRAFT_133621 [Penicilliopsis zonata CBS 506.65]